MTDQENSTPEPPILHDSVDADGIPILDDVVEELDEEEQLAEQGSTPSSAIPSQAIEIDKLKESLRQELSDEINEVIQSALLDTAIQVTSQVEQIIERKLSDTLQERLGKQLKTALKKRFRKRS